MANKRKEGLPDRIKTLETISGLEVLHRREKGENVFEFFVGEMPVNVKTIFTYPKAKLFAEGVAFGFKLGCGTTAR